MNRRTLPIFLAVFALLVLVAPSARGVGQPPHLTSGFYDHQVIQYNATPEVTSSPQAAQLIAHGNIVYHIVDDSGNPPAVQCARLLAALPQDQTSCNVLNRIPTDHGTDNQYTGGAWNLQIFQWNKGVTPTELSQDSDITNAVNNLHTGTLKITSTLVRCPVNDFSTLR